MCIRDRCTVYFACLSVFALVLPDEMLGVHCARYSYVNYWRTAGVAKGCMILRVEGIESGRERGRREAAQ